MTRVLFDTCGFGIVSPHLVHEISRRLCRSAILRMVHDRRGNGVDVQPLVHRQELERSLGLPFAPNASVL